MSEQDLWEQVVSAFWTEAKYVNLHTEGGPAISIIPNPMKMLCLQSMSTRLIGWVCRTQCGGYHG